MLKRILRKVVVLGLKVTTYGLKKGPHITRYYMYDYLSQYSEPRSCDAQVLSISHSEKLGTLLGFSETQIVDASYPEFNILNLPFEDQSFDAIVSDQVLEHIEGSPQKAIDETFRILKKGGIALHTTCFLNPIHLPPHDYWRFTPDALKLLTSKHGEVIDADGWGNPYVGLYCFFGLCPLAIPHTRWHPVHWLATYNDCNWPMVTWILAKKH